MSPVTLASYQRHLYQLPSLTSWIKQITWPRKGYRIEEANQLRNLELLRFNNLKGEWKFSLHYGSRACIQQCVLSFHPTKRQLGPTAPVWVPTQHSGIRSRLGNELALGSEMKIQGSPVDYISSTRQVTGSVLANRQDMSQLCQITH